MRVAPRLGMNELVCRCVCAGPEEVLRELGFVRDGLVFRRNVGEVHDVVEFYLRDLPFRDSARFVVNLGAYHPRVHRVLGDPLDTSPLPLSCTVESRVNRGDQERDLWWKVTARHEAIVGARVASHLRQYLEPWFKIANDLEKLSEETIKPQTLFVAPDSLAPAAMAVVLGQSVRAQARLEFVVKRINVWRRERVERYRQHDPFGTAVLTKAHFMTTGKRTTKYEFDEEAWLQVLNS